MSMARMSALRHPSLSLSLSPFFSLSRRPSRPVAYYRLSSKFTGYAYPHYGHCYSDETLGYQTVHSFLRLSACLRNSCRLCVVIGGTWHSEATVNRNYIAPRIDWKQISILARLGFCWHLLELWLLGRLLDFSICKTLSFLRTIPAISESYI